MKTTVVYGAYCAIAHAVLNLVMYFTGLQTEKLAQGRYVQWLGVVVFGTLLFLGMKEVRENKPHQALPYGGAFVTGLLIAIFGGLFSAVYTYIHFTFVNPDFPQYMDDFLRTQMQESGAPAAAIEAATKYQAIGLKPWVQAVASIFITPILGALLSLLLAIFAKRPLPEGVDEAPSV